MKKALAIINPISGTGSKKSLPELLGRAYSDLPYELVLTYTKEAGHGYELARRAASEGYDHVIAVGGDGTVNEVARALRCTQTALAIIPKGSGNGLARAVGMPVSTEKAIKALTTGRRVSIDSCEVNDIPFFCTCGMGFDAAVSKHFAEAGTRGPMTYLKTMIEQYRVFQPNTYHVSFGESDLEPFDTEAFVIVVANASQYGNNAYIAPEADLSDGLLDLALIRPFGTLDAPLVLGDLMRKRLGENKYYETLQAREIIIERGHSGPVHIDGEPLDLGTKVHVRLLPRSLQVIVPA